MTQNKISTWQNFSNQNWDKQDEQFSILTITGSFFGAKYGRLKRILPVCILLSIICMQFSGLALAWLHKAASTLNIVAVL